MQIYNVDIPQIVEDKIREQALVIALDKPSVAIQWYDMIFEKILSLDSFPKRCSESPESQYYTYVVRKLLVSGHRVLFRIVDHTMRILDFKSGRQN